MPHFGLIDENSLGSEAAALQRARLHIRGGKRRLSQGKVSLGIITLYDALVFALQWYIISPERRKMLQIDEADNLNDDKTVFAILMRSGVLDDTFDYEIFDELVNKSLEQDMSGYDYKGTIEVLESVMTQLGVMPFDENELPPEDPSTF